MIAFHAAVHNGRVALLSDAFFGDGMVNPVGISPHCRVDFAEFDRRAGVVHDRVFEVLFEIPIVQEDIWIMIPAIEVPLDGLDGLNDTVQFLVSSEDDERCVGSRLFGVGHETSRREDFVMLLTNLSSRVP